MSQKILIRKHIAKLGAEYSLNWFITISFPFILDGGKISRAGMNDLPSFHRLLGAYANYISIEIFGRSKRGRAQERWLPFIAIPEFLTRQNDKTHPHWHCLAKIPKEREREIIELSNSFWEKQGRKYCGVPVAPHFQRIYNTEGASNYSMKWLDDEFTLEYAVVRGI